VLLFPILFVLLGLELLISPILIWGAVPQRWHPALALAYAAIGVVVVVLWTRNFMRERRQASLHPTAGAHWRWSAGTSAELFRRKIDTYLAMQGWRITFSCVTATGRVELIMHKDRLSLALLCVGPRPPSATPDDILHLQNVCAGAHAIYAAIVTATPADPRALAAVRTGNLLLLRYADLANLDEVMYKISARRFE
jgi:hypothetical protein